MKINLKVTLWAALKKEHPKKTDIKKNPPKEKDIKNKTYQEAWLVISHLNN